MQQPSPLFNFITKENHSGVPAKDFLAAITKQHPYFAAAHFYLLQQIKTGDAGYDLQVAKTAVLFNNPHWLNFQLQKPATVYQEITNEILPAENSGNDDDNAVTPISISSAEEKAPHLFIISFSFHPENFPEEKIFIHDKDGKYSTRFMELLAPYYLHL